MNSHITKESIICPEFCLSLATFPFMLTLSLIDSFTQGLTELGQASEEIFRGDRLPVIQLDGKNKG